MYEIQRRSTTPDNFHRGYFPAMMGEGDVKSGTKIRRHAPVVKTDDGHVEATAATIDKLVGIAADDASGGIVVFYETGDFQTGGVVLPDDVTLEALIPACRKLSIFLK